MGKKKSQKKKISSSGENPFNIKVNRSKFSVLNQKVKGTRGLPGISHSLCNAKRKEEFHKKKVQSQKANKFVDKRFISSSLSLEEQATVRLVEERKKKFKKNLFNLNDDESLTHKGIPIKNSRNLKDAVNDSDDEEQLDASFVKHAHFGGFTEDTSSTQKTRKEIIDELIVESKRRKMERKLEKEKNEELIEALDKQWKEMHHQLIPAMKGKKQKFEKNSSDKNDPFDVLLNELKFEIRTSAPVPIKTPEEIEQEEKEKLKKLEEERNKRMMNPVEYSESKDNQLSADSLYDGLDIQFEPIDDQENGDVNVNTNENSDNDRFDESSEESENEDGFNDKTESNDAEINSSIDDSEPDFPYTVEKLSSMIDSQSEELHVIVENIVKDKIKCKSKQNVKKLEIFFGVVIEYIMNSNKNPTEAFKILEGILPSLYSIAEVSSVVTAEKILKYLDEEEEIFYQSKGKKMKRSFPRFQSLMLFKIISVLYSVSDFKHPVVTPAIVFMCDVLSSAYAVSYQNIYSRLFITKILYDCVSLSKRYIPEVLMFLNKALELGVERKKKFNLLIEEEVTEQKTELSFKITDKLCNSAVKISIVLEVVELLHKFAVLYKQCQCFREIFSGSLDIMKKMMKTNSFINFPSFLRKAMYDFVDFVEGDERLYKPLVFENKKPVPLKLFEPAFESKFTKRKDDIQKKRKLIKNVNQKIRKEQKGILRETRRDNQVVAAEKLRETVEADEERKRKVKQLYQELAMQEGEFKKFMKKK